MPHVNAWGEPIEIVEDPDDIYWVPAAQRKDTDEGADSDALEDETGDDLDGWQPGDPV